MKKFGLTILWVVVGIAVLRGIIRYNQADGSGWYRAGEAIFMAIADITFLWIPVVLDWIVAGAESLPGLISQIGG